MKHLLCKKRWYFKTHLKMPYIFFNLTQFQILIPNFQILFENVRCNLVHLHSSLAIQFLTKFQFPRRGLSKSLHCHVIPFQTQQCDVNSNENYSNLKVISCDNSRNAVFVWSTIEMYRIKKQGEASAI